MDERLRLELLDDKLRFTRLWAEHVLSSTNEEWSSEQKRFIDALFENHRKNRLKETCRSEPR